MKTKKSHPLLWRMVMNVAFANVLIGISGFLGEPFTVTSLFSVVFILLGGAMFYFTNDKWLVTRALLITSGSYSIFFAFIFVISSFMGTTEWFVSILFMFFSVTQIAMSQEPPFNPLVGVLDDD